MNAPFSPVRIFALLLAAGGLCGRAEEGAGADRSKLRGAISRAIDFLDREGDTWMDEKDCNACHHMPLLLWSHREAGRRGFVNDQARLNEFTEWTEARTQKINAGLEMLALLRLATPEKPAPELTKLIAEAQLADGSWKPANQFATMQRRETPEATENSARLFLLALGTQEADAAAAEAARVKAAPLLATASPPKSMETLVVRALYAQRFGKAGEVDALRGEILQHQHADGGWSFMIGEAKSDPLATGEALFLLQRLPEGPPAEALAKAHAWLLSRQREDGSWPIDITRISRMDRSAPAKSKSFKAATDIYTYWGTAWAAIGLLEGMPISSP